jgi:hypothetical protein
MHVKERLCVNGMKKKTMVLVHHAQRSSVSNHFSDSGSIRFQSCKAATRNDSAPTTMGTMKTVSMVLATTPETAPLRFPATAPPD